ncbi:unnamed protein product [Ixodes hexagonus]
MAIQCAVLIACVAATSAWQTQITIRNPENNPLLNDHTLGPLQQAWKALEQGSNGSFVLMFRSKNKEPHISCVTVNTTITNATTKTATYTRTYYNMTTNNYTQITFPVRALNQTDYKIENVIRVSLNGFEPSKTPVPRGSNMYIEYGDYECNSSSLPLPDMLLAARSFNQATVPVEGQNYLDFYVVYNQPTCNVIRSPFLGGGCDFWLAETSLNTTLEKARNITNPSTLPAENTAVSAREDQEQQAKAGPTFPQAVFKSLPTACRYAFIVACGYPNEYMYNETLCKQPSPEEGREGESDSS